LSDLKKGGKEKKAARQNSESAARYAVEVVSDDAVERRLHDLTLDFGVTTATAISRPLQKKEIGAWRLKLWVPRDLFQAGAQAIRAFKQRRLPLVMAVEEFPALSHELLRGYEARLNCETFSQARTILEKRRARCRGSSADRARKYPVRFLSVGPFEK
jgi:post-segregation antitoxin (ccd killing protein)